MHQFFSSVLSFILAPSLWIVVLLLAGFLYKKRFAKRVCYAVAICIFLLFGNGWLLNWYARQYQPAPLVLNAGTVYSCGIVPGGFASPDIDGDAVFNSTADRFIQVLKLYKQGHINHILVNGGNGKKELKTFREGEWVKQQLVIMGVPDSVIFVEDQSDNTAENALNAKRILNTHQLPPPYLLISSAQHLPRASIVFRNAGVPVIEYPCSYIAGRGISTFSDLIPTIGTLFTWQVYLKETAGYLWYR